MSRGRLFFTVTTIFILVGTGAAWILSNQNIIIQNSWSVPLGTGFGILGVLFGFCQWTLPFPSAESKTPADIATNEAQERFLKQIYDRLTEGNGALVIYAKMVHVGDDVKLMVNHKTSSGYGGWEEHSKANIVERTVNGRSIIAAVFPDLKPDTYKLWTYWEDVTILPRQITEIDRRGQGEKERKRQSLSSNLRIASLFIGLGGVWFLVGKYAMNVNLQNYSLGAMAVGVLLLIYCLALVAVS